MLNLRMAAVEAKVGGEAVEHWAMGNKAIMQTYKPLPTVHSEPE